MKQNLKSGFILSLIALPLSIGIALASGAPASAGLLAAIVGGMLGSWMGGSRLTINGPAAGLIVVVLGAVDSLGMGNSAAGFRYMLAAAIAAGAIQVIMGAMRMATLGLAFPSAAIHGMLSAIGAIIIAKQVPVMLGVKAASTTIIGLFGEIPTEISHMNPEVAFIGLVSLGLIISLPKLPFKMAKKLPAPLVVVALGIVMGKYFDLEHEHTVSALTWSGAVGPKFLLNLPDNFRGMFSTPDFGRFFTFANLQAVATIALIASIESVLSTFAVDKLDPKKGTSDLNRDLLSKGVCNMALGFIGGLPIISEIVRSSANITNGATSKWSNFYHGTFILLFVALFPQVLHMIPLSCLAAILISVGWRLAHPSQFMHALHVGPDHIAAFVTTFVVTLATDLLIGVGAGIAVEIAVAILHGVRPRDFLAFRFKEADQSGGTTRVTVTSPLIFSNSLKMRKALERYLEKGRSVILDLTNSHFIDHTVLDQLDRLQLGFKSKGLSLTPELHELHKPASKHPLASRRRRHS